MLRIVWRALHLPRASANAMTSSRMMSDDGGITEEGGKLAKKAAADESQYVRQLEQEQWKALQKHHQDEINEHMEDIKRHEEKIRQHKERLSKLKGPSSK